MRRLVVKPRGGSLSSALRRVGQIPAVMYGPEDQPTPIAVDRRAELPWAPRVAVEDLR